MYLRLKEEQKINEDSARKLEAVAVGRSLAVPQFS